MSKHSKPWTFEPFELYRDDTWAILDPNLAQMVAIFYDQAEAEAYLKWRNRRQAKKQEKLQAKKQARDHAEDARWAWPQ